MLLLLILPIVILDSNYLKRYLDILLVIVVLTDLLKDLIVFSNTVLGLLIALFLIIGYTTK